MESQRPGAPPSEWVQRARKPVIDEKAVLPLGIVLLLLSGAWEAAHVSGKVDAMMTANSKYDESIQSIDRRLARIEGRLEVQPIDPGQRGK